MKTIINLVDDGQLWKFHGGINPPSRKERTNSVGISAMPLSDKLFLSLSQHIGQPAIPVVNVGDYVTKGQLLAKQDGFISAVIIAPTSGTISEITLHSNTHASGIKTQTIVLVPDLQEKWRTQEPLTLANTREELLARINQAGITGLGGASFPTSVKLATTQAIDFLILNGAECEPYITADDLLMQERSDMIVSGIEIMHKLLNPRRIIIAIEDNKPLAVTALTQAVNRVADRVNIIVRAIPTLYPAGGEKQLIEVLTSKQVPKGKIPADIGIVMQNIATSYAVANSVLEDQPLLSRIVTVSGDLVNKPGNYEVAIGTPIEALLKHAEFKAQPQQKIIIGGPMMGFALHHIDAPVIKSTNCIIAASSAELSEPPPEQNCIRCGDCEQVCPANLLPQQLQWYAKDQDQQKLLDHDLFDCIECGACAFVCPSAIPLVQYYRVAKAEIRQTNEDKRQAERAKERFEQRNLRLERDKEERLLKNKRAAEARQAAMAGNNDGDAVAAALARIKAKKAAAQQGSPAAPADASKDRVAAAIARAKAKKAQQANVEPAADSESVTATTSETVDPQKARVAAAIARAKAKKAQQQVNDEPAADSEPVTATTAETVDPQKARVAAAIARAKAKKAQQQVNDEPAPDSEPMTETVVPQKARVAAAIARAKAKRAQQQVEAEPATTVDSAPETAPKLVDPQKARVAAAIARAKAKRAQQQSASPSSMAQSTDPIAEQQTLPEQQPEQKSELTEQPAPSSDKKARIAAVIAKAKAKKSAQQTEHNSVPNSVPNSEPSNDQNNDLNNDKT